ncbi:nitrite reductase small subunit NirD [Amycolatopsis sp. CA-230715]|uniref:nitrite reductase small subunit NirD n=1 Tax=Amycolatopsis sp. CA-230715 TaxID=2745196 RepID=UPI001C01BF5A|nr:nitrite reductase small subunit NirD [Amycolatopsis sp. CA-230715]QWF76717.1 Nitrite reductase (NADH) small subunit [Amycolatopsis sp. CA-230715]
MTVLTEARGLTWIEVCPLEAVPAGGGVAALLPDGSQVAVFRTAEGVLFGLSHVDPCSGAAVLARGIVGDAGGVPVVASPVYKERFDLRTGECLDAEGVRVRTYPVRVADGLVHVGSA